MKNEKLELVVLLRGNYIVVAALQNQKETLTNLLHECCKKSNEDPNLFLKWEDVTILAKEIVGWYFRQPVVSNQEQIMELVKKQTELLENQTDEGDDWKED